MYPRLMLNKKVEFKRERAKTWNYDCTSHLHHLHLSKDGENTVQSGALGTLWPSDFGFLIVDRNSSYYMCFQVGWVRPVSTKCKEKLIKDIENSCIVLRHEVLTIWTRLTTGVWQDDRGVIIKLAPVWFFWVPEFPHRYKTRWLSRTFIITITVEEILAILTK